MDHNDGVGDEDKKLIYLQEIHAYKAVQSPPFQFDTTLAKQVLPFIDLVRRFNGKRLATKSTREVQVEQQYMHKVSIIKQKLITFTQLTSDIAHWQCSFRQEHGTSSSPSDIPDQVTDTMSCRQTLKILLSKF